MIKQSQFIYGIRAIQEAIETGTDFHKIFLQKGVTSPLFKALEGQIHDRKIPHSYVPAERLQRITTQNHQGAIAEISEVGYAAFEETIERILQVKEHPMFLLLDGLTDVRNFGAILRTASCTGVDAVIVPKQGMAPLNKDAIKTSAGAAFTLPVARVDHLKDAVYYLKSSGVQIVSATEKAESLIYNVDFKKASAIIMGSEDIGIHPSLLKLSDNSAKLPMTGNIASLNVSVACGVFLYEVIRQRLD
ncbi:23S rRNA (guanosine(2251)-2'-O)-methyltransferase RlmB [Flavobacteriaceae bacterium]|jgi:23S rRNA (guanosine2251-2'-O)-methyltransferase|nr:23S rRNA (guanosine(2251)-2'-O)-methyltransferase RlmB [Flavobacteriaceae bacterium]